MVPRALCVALLALAALLSCVVRMENAADVAGPGASGASRWTQTELEMGIDATIPTMMETTMCGLCASRARTPVVSVSVVDRWAVCGPCARYVARNPHGFCATCAVDNFPSIADRVVDGVPICGACRVARLRTSQGSQDALLLPSSSVLPALPVPPSSSAPRRPLSDIANVVEQRPKRARVRSVRLDGYVVQGVPGIPDSASQLQRDADAVRLAELEAADRVEQERAAVVEAARAGEEAARQAAEATRVAGEARHARVLARKLRREESFLDAYANFRAKFASLTKYPSAPCDNCGELYPGQKMSAAGRCVRCASSPIKAEEWGPSNSMVPDPVPIELSRLNEMEKMLIARLMPLVKVFVLPKGQLAYAGHTVFFAQSLSP